MRTVDPPPFRTTSEDVGAAVVVHVEGELDCMTAGELSGCLRAATRPPAPVVLDLTGVRFLGAQCIGLLLDHHETCLRRGCALVVVANTPVVLRPLQVLELTDVLDVRPSLPALRELGAAPSI